MSGCFLHVFEDTECISESILDFGSQSNLHIRVGESTSYVGELVVGETTGTQRRNVKNSESIQCDNIVRRCESTCEVGHGQWKLPGL